MIKGHKAGRFFPQPEDQKYTYYQENIHLLIKVETHNHPTAIAPFAGAATGSGGEVRDEGATGKGSKPKAGLAGYSVSNLRIPGSPATEKPTFLINQTKFGLYNQIFEPVVQNVFFSPSIFVFV